MAFFCYGDEELKHSSEACLMMLSLFSRVTYFLGAGITSTLNSLKRFECS